MISFLGPYDPRKAERRSSKRRYTTL